MQGRRYEYFCNRCHYFVETKGPWPFRKVGRKRRPCDPKNETGSDPIDGLMALVYCPTCDKKKEYPIVEYQNPLPSLDDVWLSTIPRKIKMLCHRCKHRVYLILPPGRVRCPRCHEGTLELVIDLPTLPNISRPVPPPQSPLRVRQGGRAIHIPKPTVVIDSAEHKGYGFERFANWFSGTIRKRLPIGDYTLLGLENEVTVERKTVSDLVKSVINQRWDFIRKCEKLSEFKKKCLVIEGSLRDVKIPYEEAGAHPNAVLGSLIAAQERWDIPVYFLDDFYLAEEFVASMLSKYHAYRWLESNGFKRCLIEGDI